MLASGVISMALNGQCAPKCTPGTVSWAMRCRLMLPLSLLHCCSVPVGLEDVSKYPYLFAELIRRGYSDEEVKQVAGMNLISVLQKVEQVYNRAMTGSQLMRDSITLLHFAFIRSEMRYLSVFQMTH